jgi:hypothetical protein
MTRHVASTRTAPLLAILVLGLASRPADAQSALDDRAGALAKDEPQANYAADPEDPWNRAFHALFTRTVKVRRSEHFARAGPLADPPPKARVPFGVSARAFDRIEGGDRAIEPLYPRFFADSPAAHEALDGPRHDELSRALRDALALPPRPPLARALFQADLWASFDFLLAVRPKGAVEAEHREELLGLLARLIRRLALSRAEIAALPDNAARDRHLAEILAPGGPWIEIDYLPDRAHEHVADDRRVARIFVKATRQPADLQGWLDGLRGGHLPSDERLGGVALVIQLLLLDADGEVVPTRLAYEVQVREFVRDRRGRVATSRLTVAELSRRALLREPDRGGLVPIGEDEPAYYPDGGDYGFAVPVGEAGAILAPLRSRCIACHGPDVETVQSLMAHGEQIELPIRRLEPRQQERARRVVEEKRGRFDYKQLMIYWKK